MIFPLPLALAGPPSEVQLKMKPWFVFLLFLQGLLVVGRIFIVDIWGSFILLMVMIVGVVTVRRTLDPLSCVSYGFMVLFTGLFDFVLLFERYSRLPGAFFSSERSIQYNVGSAVFLLAPLLDFMGAFICYKVYAECEGAALLPDTMAMVPEYGAVPPPGAEESGQSARTFRPFQGRPFLISK